MERGYFVSGERQSQQIENAFDWLKIFIIMQYIALPNLRSQGRDRIVVSTLRCGRNNPGSNPGHGTFLFTTL